MTKLPDKPDLMDLLDKIEIDPKLFLVNALLNKLKLELAENRVVTIAAQQKKLEAVLSDERTKPEDLHGLLVAAWADKEDLSKIVDELQSQLRRISNELTMSGPRFKLDMPESDPTYIEYKNRIAANPGDAFSEKLKLTIDNTARKSRSNVGAKGAAGKLRKDPKQRAKNEAKKLWKEWHEGQTNYKSGAEFALHIVSVFPELGSTKSVERWVTEWRREAEEIRQNRH